MPTRVRVRCTLNAVIPRDDWREPIDELSPMWYRVKGRDWLRQFQRTTSAELLQSKYSLLK